METRTNGGRSGAALVQLRHDLDLLVFTAGWIKLDHERGGVVSASTVVMLESGAGQPHCRDLRLTEADTAQPFERTFIRTFRAALTIVLLHRSLV